VAEDNDKVGILSPIVDVKRSELAATLVSLVWIFSAITAYYMIKPIRGQVLQELIGVDNKPKALIVTTAFVGVFAYVYGRVVAAVPKNKLIIWTYVAFVACLGAFALAFKAPSAGIGYVFFVWVSTFNVMVVSQFWALAADTWTKEEGARLFGFIGLGTVSGGVAGTSLTKVAKTLPTYQMLFLSAGILAFCLGLSLYILNFGAKKGGAAAEQKPKEAPKDAPKVNAIGMVLSSPYLRLIAVMTLLLNLVNSNNEWILDKLFERQGGHDSRTFYATFYLYQNVLTVLIQVFLTGRIQRRFGARVALLFLPLVGLLGGSAFLLIPTLAIVRSMKVAENATDYSIQSNTREFLYLPTTKLEKYAAKNVNDTFVVRIGDALAAASIEIAKLMISSFGDSGLKLMVVADIVLGVVWIAVVLRIGAVNRRLMEAGSAAAASSDTGSTTA
jgi:ATP:ADP antiporter, AAA family